MELLWGPHREQLRQEAWMVLIEGAAARRWGRVSRVAHGKGGLASWEDRLVNWVGRVAGPMWLCSMPRTRRLPLCKLLLHTILLLHSVQQGLHIRMWRSLSVGTRKWWRPRWGLLWEWGGSTPWWGSSCWVALAPLLLSEAHHVLEGLLKLGLGN